MQPVHIAFLFHYSNAIQVARHSETSFSMCVRVVYKCSFVHGTMAAKTSKIYIIASQLHHFVIWLLILMDACTAYDHEPIQKPCHKDNNTQRVSFTNLRWRDVVAFVKWWMWCMKKAICARKYFPGAASRFRQFVFATYICVQNNLFIFSLQAMVDNIEIGIFHSTRTKTIIWQPHAAKPKIVFIFLRCCRNEMESAADNSKHGTRGVRLIEWEYNFGLCYCLMFNNDKECKPKRISMMMQNMSHTQTPKNIAENNAKAI